MAYSVLRSTGDYRLYLVLTKGTPSVNGNYTPVTVDLYLYKNSGTNIMPGLYALDSRNWSWSGSGITNRSGSYVFDFRGLENYGKIQLRKETFNVAHNSDGSRGDLTVSATVAFAHSLLPNSVTIGETISFTTIPRASTVTTFNAFTIGNNIPWAVDRKHAGFTHTIELRIGSTVINTQTAQGASGTMPINASMKEQILNLLSSTSMSVDATLRVTTFSGTTQIGSVQTATAKGTARTEDISPSFTSISHSEYVADVASKVGAYVKDKSRLSLAINGANARYGASISSYRLSVAGQTINAHTGTTAVINASGTVKITGRIVDSRGIAVTGDVDITVLNYQPPKLENVRFERCLSNGVINPFGEYVKITMKATVQSLLVGGVQKNTLTTKVLSKRETDSDYTERNSQLRTGLTYEGSIILSSYAVDYAYSMLARAIDIFETVSVIGLVAIGEVLMHWGRYSVAIGMMIPDTNHALYLPERGMKNLGSYIDKDGLELNSFGGTLVEYED